MRGSLEFFLHLSKDHLSNMGWTYNTVNPDAPTNAPTIVAVGVTFTVLAFIVVSLRMYVRKFMVNAVSFGTSATSSPCIHNS